jgi:hypothetical protein
MENIDWGLAIPAGLAIAIFVGGLLMMFTGIWTSRNR